MNADLDSSGEKMLERVKNVIFCFCFVFVFLPFRIKLCDFFLTLLLWIFLIRF